MCSSLCDIRHEKKQAAEAAGVDSASPVTVKVFLLLNLRVALRNLGFIMDTLC